MVKQYKNLTKIEEKELKKVKLTNPEVCDLLVFYIDSLDIKNYTSMREVGVFTLLKNFKDMFGDIPGVKEVSPENFTFYFGMDLCSKHLIDSKRLFDNLKSFMVKYEKKMEEGIELTKDEKYRFNYLRSSMRHEDDNIKHWSNMLFKISDSQLNRNSRESNVDKIAKIGLSDLHRHIVDVTPNQLE